MDDVNDRLRQAVERSPLSIRGFHRRMDETDVHGTAYGTVHRYLKGETTPSVAFLREAARVLDVTPSWLILGEGDPSPERAAVEKAESRARGTHMVDMVEGWIEEGFATYTELPAHVQATILSTWDRLRADLRHRVIEGGKPGEIKLDEVAELAATFLANRLQDGLRAWPVEPGELRQWQLESYALGICQAVTHLIPDLDLVEDWAKGGPDE